MTPAGHFLQLKHICIRHQILVHRSGAGAALGNAPDHQALASAAVTGGKNAFRGGHVVLGDQIAPVVPRKTKGLCHIALAAHKARGNQPPVFGDIVPGRAQAVPVQHGRIGAVPGDHGHTLSISSAMQGDSMVSSRASIRSALPRMVLISPRKGVLLLQL